jgi:hypothetical protein
VFIILKTRQKGEKEKNFQKKFGKRLASIEKGRTFALAFRKGGVENRSLTGCEQIIQD